MNSRMNDYKFETNGRSVAYNGKLETSMDFAPPAKDQKRAIDNHNIMIENESRQLWKEAYLGYHHIPVDQRPDVCGDDGVWRKMSIKKFADQAASNYVNTWTKK